MKKVLNTIFGGKRIYIIVNLFFALALALYVVADLDVIKYDLFSDSMLTIIIKPLDDFLLDYWFFWIDIIHIFIVIIDFLFYYALIILPVLMVINIASFITVKNGRKSGIVLSAFLGFIGGFIAANTVNKNYFGAKAINIIFSIYFWILAVFPNILEMDHCRNIYPIIAVFPVIMFILCIGVSKYVSSEKLLTVNLLSNAVISAVTVIAMNTDLLEVVYDWSWGDGHQCTILLIVLFIYAYAPSFILYLKYRKGRKEKYDFKTHLHKTFVVSVCNFNVLCIFCFVLNAWRIVMFTSVD